ncbi:hypothetical protein [Shewanella waksmanii]|uniref:hypothetical protein n=1 Tax=Shewanella waksmanii TaxID=213783 RepID=UPI003735BB49
MDIFKEKPYLLFLLAGLVFARFVCVPVIEWQNERKATLVLESKRVMKAEQAMANEQKIEPLLPKLRALVKANRERLYPFQAENQFKLQNQQNLEALIEKYALNVTGIGWLATKQVNEFNLTLFQLQVRFQGDGVKFPGLMAEIESQAQWVEVDDFVFAFRRQSTTRIGDANGQITLNYYMNNEVGDAN